MDLVFDDGDTAVVCLVGNQLVGRLKLDVVAIPPEFGHQIGAPLDNAWPTGEVVILGACCRRGAPPAFGRHRAAR